MPQEHPEAGALGPLIRESRERAGMSRATLARHAGLSESTLRNLERGRETSAGTVRALMEVRELGLPGELRAAWAPEAGALNAWLAPGFSPLSFFRQMLGVLSGAGGLVEQSYLYYDHASAADWAAIASQQEYADALRVTPLNRAAAQVVRSFGGRGADVIALGPGDGRMETRLVGHLAGLLPHPAIRFYLLDISQPLLAEAYRHASATLGGHGGITPIAILGDFHCLPQCGQLSYDSPAAPRRKVVVMLGGTFGNLESEGRFLRDALCGFPAGTLLLLDYPCPFAPADQPAEIRRRDPWLAGGTAWRDRVVQFWTGPLRRYVPGCTGVEVRLDLSAATPAIPGGYAVEAMARVQVRGEADRAFSIFRIKRYDSLALCRACRDLGWDPVDGWPYGQDVGYPRALALLCKR